MESSERADGFMFTGAVRHKRAPCSGGGVPGSVMVGDGGIRASNRAEKTFARRLSFMSGLESTRDSLKARGSYTINLS